MVWAGSLKTLWLFRNRNCWSLINPKVAFEKMQFKCVIKKISSASVIPCLKKESGWKPIELTVTSSKIQTGPAVWIHMFFGSVHGLGEQAPMRPDISGSGARSQISFWMIFTINLFLRNHAQRYKIHIHIVTTGYEKLQQSYSNLVGKTTIL